MTVTRPRRLRWLVVSLLLTTAAVVPLAYWLMPHVLRGHLLGKLSSADPDERQRGLNYLIRRAGQDARVLEGALRQATGAMEAGDDEHFGQIATALQLAGKWHRPAVPADLWLGWIAILGDDPDPESRILAAQQVAQLHDLVADPRPSEMLAQWLRDAHEGVRYNALVATAELAGHAEANAVYARLIAEATGDPTPAIAREAWIFCGLLGAWPQPPGAHATGGTEPAEVAESRLWALGRIRPERIGPAVAALNDPDVDPNVRAMAAYVLALSPDDAAGAALTDYIAAGRDAVTADNQLAIWRAILAPNRRTPLPPEFLTGDDPLRLAAAYRQGLTDSHAPQDDLVLRLAQLDGTPVNQRHVEIAADWSDTLRLAAVAVTTDPDPGMLRRVFASPFPTLRDAACVIAAERFSPQQNETLVDELLSDFSDDAKRSGAILAGLTGLQRPLLAAKLRDEDIWAVQQIQRLGLWMQGSQPEFDHAAPALLTGDDLPATTILLAMLHRRHRSAFDTVFSSRTDEPEFSPQTLNLPAAEGQAPVPLEKLLTHYRWYHVLRRFLPPDAPPLWLWADDRLQQFQLDVLRNWHLLRRAP